MANRAKPTFPQINKSHPLAQGLVFDAALHEGAGNKTTDTVNGLVGTLTNITDSTAWSGGAYGNSVLFNNSNGYISFASNPIFNVTKFTASVLFNYHNSTGGDWTLFSKMSGDSTATFWLRIQAGGHDSLRFVVNSDASGLSTADGTLVRETTNHAVFVYDLSTMKIYLNGKQVASQSFSTTPPTNTTAAAIGAKTGGTGDFYNSNIYGVSLWNIPFTPEMVSQLSADPYQIYKKKKIF